MTPHPSHSKPVEPAVKVGILGWSAWQRVLAVLPLLLLLWLAVAWALADGTPAP